MNSIGAIAPAWAVPSATARDGGVFRRAAQDSKKPNGSAEASGDSTQASVGPHKLKPAQVREVAELTVRDEQVRAHEAAHQAAAGSLGGAASFTYETGPDGKSYAIGGEVPIDMSGGRTPEETIARAQQIRAAALAPADPSPQDLSVAADASHMEAMARRELSAEQLAAVNAAANPGTGSGHASSAQAAAESHPSSEITKAGATDTSVIGASRGAAGSTAPAAPASTHVTHDVGAQSDAAISAVETARSLRPTSAQMQQVARLAWLAYARHSGSV